MSQQPDINNGRGAGEARPIQTTQGTAKSPEQLREEIARTRSALSQDVAALGEKLNPEHLKENAREMLHDAKDAAKEGAKDMIRDAREAAVESLRHARDHAIDSISETYHEVSTRVQDVGGSTALFVSTHAIPLSLVGLGLGWLALSVGHTRRQRLREFGGDYDYGTAGYELGGGHDLRGRAAGAMRAARDTVGGVAGRASHALTDQREHLMERAGEVRSQIVQRAADVRDRTAELGHRAYDRTAELGHRAYDGIGRAGARARDLSGENPMAVGLLALAAGIGVGLLLPSTRRENRLMGETRDRLARDARRTASELGRSVQRGANELREALSE